jgi:anaerobic magnesium-protoporphyrin IX monomethyl ester cyclase
VDLLLTHGYFLKEDVQERKIMRPYPPLGLLYVASHLKARGFAVEVFDSTFGTFDELREVLVRDRPPVVGIYCNLMTKANVLRLILECQKAGAAVVLGGPEPPHHAAEYLDRGADAVVVGEGEHTLEELLPRLLSRRGSRDWNAVSGLVYRDEAGATIRTPPRPLIADLDAQPWPDREAIDVPRYLSAWRSRHGAGSVSIATARGCPYTCAWCSRSVFGETHRRRSVGSVADEAAWIADRYRPESLWYVDDVFTIHKGWTLAYADEMARRGLKLPFECISRAERIDDDVASALARLGCVRVWIGSESGSQRILDAMDRRMTVEQVRATTARLQRRGIEVGLFIMLGYDGEEEADLEATVAHLKATRADAFLTTVAYPIKGTPYYDRAGDRVRSEKKWEERSDRDLRVEGQRSTLYYRLVRHWMTGEVALDRAWRERRYLRAARSGAQARIARLGMRLVSSRTEA